MKTILMTLLVGAFVSASLPVRAEDSAAMKKDLSEMVEEMRSLGWSPLVAKAALDGFVHASKAGLGAKDCSMLPVSWSSKPQKL